MQRPGDLLEDVVIALYADLPVYRNTYQLILKVLEYTREFGREYKYTLSQEMKNILHN